jgi:hypothetical protein
VSLPIFQSDSKEMSMLQTQWASQLNPVLTNPFLQGRVLKSVVLASGANVVNHGLGRKLQGWVPVRLRASATLYDTQDTNTSPALTLNLTASAAVTVDIYVF